MTLDSLTTGETGEAGRAPGPSVAVPRTEIEYVVLFSNDPGSWVVAERVKAASPDAAIKAFIGVNDPGKTEYVAVASRYWSPQSFDVEVETTRKLVPKAAK